MLFVIDRQIAKRWIEMETGQQVDIATNGVECVNAVRGAIVPKPGQPRPRPTYEHVNGSIINQNGVHATSGFEMCFAIGSQHLGCRGSQPKHVSNPA